MGVFGEIKTMHTECLPCIYYFLSSSRSFKDWKIRNVVNIVLMTNLKSSHQLRLQNVVGKLSLTFWAKQGYRMQWGQARAMASKQHAVVIYSTTKNTSSITPVHQKLSTWKHATSKLLWLKKGSEVPIFKTHKQICQKVLNVLPRHKLLCLVWYMQYD